jgi:hypothetical protein
MAYVLFCALRRIALRHTQFAKATCGTIRLKLLKVGGLVRTMTTSGAFAELPRHYPQNVTEDRLTLGSGAPVTPEVTVISWDRA